MYSFHHRRVIYRKDRAREVSSKVSSEIWKYPNLFAQITGKRKKMYVLFLQNLTKDFPAFKLYFTQLRI